MNCIGDLKYVWNNLADKHSFLNYVHEMYLKGKLSYELQMSFGKFEYSIGDSDSNNNNNNSNIYKEKE